MEASAERPGDRAPIRLERLERLQRLTEALSAALTPEEVTTIIFDRGLDLVGARAVAVFWDAQGLGELELVHGLGLSETFVHRFRRVPAGASLPSAMAYRTGAPVWLGSPEEIRARFPEIASIADAEGDQAWAALPLVVERSRGAIGLRFDQPRSFDDEERAFVLAVARQCAQALERAQLFSQEKRLAARVRSLQSATAELSAAATPGEVAAILFRRLLAVGAREAAVYLADASGTTLALAYDHALAPETRRAFARISSDARVPVAEAFRTGAPVWTIGAEAMRAASPELAGVREPLEEGAWGAIPLRAEASTLGALAFALEQGRALDEAQQGDLVALAQQCAAALDRARLFEAEKRLAERLSRVQSIANALAGASTPAEVARAAFGAVEALGASGGEIHALEGTDRLRLLARVGAPDGEAAEALPLDALAPAAEVVRTGKAIWAASREELAERFPGWGPDPTSRCGGAWAVVPLLASGNTLGAFAVGFPVARELGQDERAFIRLVAQPCAQALERARLFEAAARARRDAEWNAAVLDSMFAAAPIGMALLDLDLRFARVNKLMARIDGIPQEGHVGRSPREILPGFPAEAIEEAFRRALETNTPLDTYLAGETPAAPGETRRWRVTWYAVRVGGEPVGVGVLVSEDRPGRR